MQDPRTETPTPQDAISTATSVALPNASNLDVVSDPATSIIAACESAKGWLAQALAGNQIEQIVEMKSQAEAIRVYSMQKQLGRDAETAAAEIVRRAERCIGLAIRKGQADGTIAKRGQTRKRDVLDEDISYPTDIVKRSSHAEITDTYAMTDNVSEGEFEKAIEEAKAEENLSRANVVRKLKGDGKAVAWESLPELAAAGKTSEQIAKELGATTTAVREKARTLHIIIQADSAKYMGRRNTWDPNRALRSLVEELEVDALSVEEFEASGLWHSVLEEYAPRLSDALKKLRKFDQRVQKLASEIESKTG